MLQILFALALAVPLAAMADDKIETLGKQNCLKPSASNVATALRGRTKDPEQKKRELIFLKAYGESSADDEGESLESLKQDLKQMRESLTESLQEVKAAQERLTLFKPLAEVAKYINEEKELPAAPLKFLTDLITARLKKAETEMTKRQDQLGVLRHKMHALKEHSDKYYELENKASDLESEVSIHKTKKRAAEDVLDWIREGQKPRAAPTDDLLEDTRYITVESLKSTLAEAKEKATSAAKEVKTIEAKISLRQAKALAKGDAEFQKFELDAITRFGSSDNGGFALCDLTVAEIAAMTVYTSDGYTELNRNLRETNKLSSEVAAFRATLSSALKKLRPYKGKVVRGSELTEEVRAKMEVGKVVTFKSFTSTSVDSPFSGTDQFEIQSKTGRFIAPYSRSYSEHEVLFDAGTKFRVVSKGYNGYRNQWVLREE